MLLPDLVHALEAIREEQGCSTVTLSIGCAKISLVFHDPALREAVLPAFSHLVCDGHGELTVHLHDHRTAPDVAPLARMCLAPADVGTIDLIDTADLTVIAQNQPQALSALLWGRATAYWIVPDALHISYIERSAPLRPLLAHWLASRGQFIVHGAAVGTTDGALLILGHGGAGKSTTALACLEAGLLYAADDHCLVRRGPNPVVNSLFSTGKLALEDLVHFPFLSPAALLSNRPPTEKIVFRFDGASVDYKLAGSMPIRAIVLAAIGNSNQTGVMPVEPSVVYRVMASSAALHFPSCRVPALQCFSHLVRNLPTFRLNLGPDRKAAPSTIEKLVRRLSMEFEPCPTIR